MGIKKGARGLWCSGLGLHKLDSRPTFFILRWTTRHCILYLFAEKVSLPAKFNVKINDIRQVKQVKCKCNPLIKQAVRHYELRKRGNNAQKISIGDARRRKAKVTSNGERGTSCSNRQPNGREISDSGILVERSGSSGQKLVD